MRLRKSPSIKNQQSVFFNLQSNPRQPSTNNQLSQISLKTQPHSSILTTLVLSNSTQQTMNNELLNQGTWWNRNWKWVLALGSGILIMVTVLLSVSGLADYAQSYSDPSLHQNAINEANTNAQVIQRLGTLEPIDNLAIMEGNTVYSKDNTTVNSTVRVQGSKGKGKMDIVANKNQNTWTYKQIQIRIKTTGEVIVVK